MEEVYKNHPGPFIWHYDLRSDLIAVRLSEDLPVAPFGTFGTIPLVVIVIEYVTNTFDYV